MKFCFVCPRYRVVPYGGIDSSTVNYANALSNRGHDVHVVVTKAGSLEDSMDGAVRVHYRPIGYTRGISRFFPGWVESAKLAFALLRLQRQHKFDLIEIPNWEGLGALPALLKLPVAIRHHTSTGDSLKAQGVVLTALEKAQMRLENLSAEWAEVNIAHNRYHAQKLSSSDRMQGIHIIPHVLPELQKGQRPDQEEQPMILCVGALTPRKGTDTMLKAAEVFLPQLMGWKLHLVGLDVDREYQRKFLDSANSDVADRVVFEGFLDDESLNERYLRCGIYFTTSLFESFGLPCLEAMRRGKALVATNAGALPELVLHQVNGFVFEPGDYQTAAEYVVRLARNYELRREMGMRSLDLAKKNSDMKIVCGHYEKIAMRGRRCL